MGGDGMMRDRGNGNGMLSKGSMGMDMMVRGFNGHSDGLVKNMNDDEIGRGVIGDGMMKSVILDIDMKMSW